MDEETGSQRENMIWPQHTASAEIPNADLFNFKLGTISAISTTYLPEPTASKSFPSPTCLSSQNYSIRMVLLWGSTCFQEFPINMLGQYTWEPENT